MKSLLLFQSHSTLVLFLVYSSEKWTLCFCQQKRFHVLQETEFCTKQGYILSPLPTRRGSWKLSSFIPPDEQEKLSWSSYPLYTAVYTTWKCVSQILTALTWFFEWKSELSSRLCTACRQDDNSEDLDWHNIYVHLVQYSIVSPCLLRNNDVELIGLRLQEKHEACKNFIILNLLFVKICVCAEGFALNNFGSKGSELLVRMPSQWPYIFIGRNVHDLQEIENVQNGLSIRNKGFIFDYLQCKYNTCIWHGTYIY